MAGREADQRAGPARRARRKDATLAEIVAVGRELLVAEGAEAVGLRAVARRVGLTAPALYRYVGSHRELMSVIARAVYVELAETLERAGRRAPDDPMARLEAAARAFRRWSLRHRAEFAAVFTSPDTGGAGSGRTGGSGHGGPGHRDGAEAGEDPIRAEGKRRFTAVFAEYFGQLWAARPFAVPRADQLAPGVVRQLEARTGDLLPGMPAGARYVFVRCWALLYGAVCLEVFGHLRWAFDNGEPLFDQALDDIAALLTPGS